MAYTTPLFSTLNQSGVYVSGVFSPSTATSTAFDPSYPIGPQGGQFAPGQKVIGDYASEFIFVTCSTAANTGDVLVVVPSSSADVSFSAVQLTSTVAATSFGRQLGVAMATATTGQTLWMQTKGWAPNLGISSLAATTAGVPLFSSPTAGKLISGSTTTAYPVYGVGLITSASSTNGTTAGYITALELGLIATTATVPPYAAF